MKSAATPIWSFVHTSSVYVMFVEQIVPVRVFLGMEASLFFSLLVCCQI